LLGVLKMALPAVAGWSEGKEMVFGAGIVVVIAASFLLALWLTRGGVRPAVHLAEG